MSATIKKTDDFKNEPFTDFTKDENKRAMEDALKKVEGELGREYELVINGERVRGESGVMESVNPANHKQVVGRFQKASAAQANRAIEAAHETFKTWSRTSANERAELLFKTAGLMRERKHEFSAWMVYEVAKTWAEADGDTAEAIDFLEFYGREMLRYAEGQPLTKIEGEENQLKYIALGVGVVVPPWNFPLAIMAGMTVAGVVTGNTVVLKPSSDAPTIAIKFFELLEEAGMSKGVVNFVTGAGGEVGDTLVDHKLTRYVAFTGSKEVGLRVNERAAKTQEGQIWIKRVVAEMGGKDAIVVDKDFDLEEAATGIVQAAFGFSGQKCSACSRAIIHQDIYDELLGKIVEKTQKLIIGNPADAKTNMSAVINRKAFKSITEFIEKGKSEGGRVVAGGTADDSEGFVIQPTVIADVEAGSTIEQQEIFGPVLAVIKARDFDHALEIANDTEFGLTGAAYTNDEANLEKARDEFHVGNLYLNRKCTGALVGVHPFGGFNMSGTDSKAGGRDYLGLFMQAKLVSEKVRKGDTKGTQRDAGV
ncbi:MAG: L-glutamate gamma-semialdehyde dehydrogenase [Pyrinomonadaceae bacterium MAG19_C2-C3]|nr:L-glutamate gamma-semialdehyde dehydrogenase [Pyrinomonadaceae bacterium MAG19_C2-C3]